MMNLFIKMKSWQIFTLMFILPFILQITLMSIFIGGGNVDPKIIFTIFPFIMLIFMALYLSWFWALGTKLNSYIKEEIRPKLNLFKFCIIYPALYMLLFIMLFVGISQEMKPNNFIFIILPLHLLAMFCMLYSLYFIAKNLIMAEKNELVKFYDFSGPFFLIWFFPIGIWIVQPRLNALYENNKK